jgi:hypothetical protein
MKPRSQVCIAGLEEARDLGFDRNVRLHGDCAAIDDVSAQHQAVPEPESSGCS